MSSEPRDWKEPLRADPTDWLLEPDNPSVRYFTLRDILERPEDDLEVIAARGAIMTSEPVIKILAAQYPAGYWVKPGRGYSPKYKATVWQLMFLADLGASRTEQIDRACQYALEHAYRADLGLFSAHKHATGTIACLNGNLLRAYFHLDYGSHPAVWQVAEALAELVVRDEFRCRYNSTVKNKPATWLPCAWGAIKALRGFAQMPKEERSPAIGKAIQLMRSKEDGRGRWSLEYTPGNVWTTIEKKGQPSKWVTLRALRVLKRWPEFG